MERYVVDKVGRLKNLPFFEQPDGTIWDEYALYNIYGGLLPRGV